MDNQLLQEYDKIYKLYGYQSADVDGIRVYEYKHGRYFGADIIARSTDREKTVNKVELEYKKLGFATTVKHFSPIQELEIDLFKSFFHVDTLRRSITKRYSDFVNKQLLGLPDNAKYEYINGSYSSFLYNNSGPVHEFEEDDVSMIDKIINTITTENGPLLTIIEAAAGYGKTCSAYEIVNRICGINDNILPLYIELARNREARIFKHILQNEIDLQFQNLVTSDVVMHQIIEGRIPIIIDGFDELLSKDMSLGSSDFRKVESMLNTIFDMLKGNAKIIITSRKTAIFSSEEYYSWMANSATDFKMLRISLSEPTIKNWLSPQQIDILRQNNFPIENVSNPVLLSYIRNLTDTELKLASKENALVNKYFALLLEREQIRQKLFMTSHTQMRIFMKLVRFMCEFNIKAEEKSTIKDLILEYNSDIFAEYIENYPDYPKPTYDELADTLSNHVLLDRKNNGTIGFINDFVFGTLIGDNLLKGKFSEHYSNESLASIINEDFASLAITAFRVQPMERKEELWNQLSSFDSSFSQDYFFQRDIYLKKRLTKDQFTDMSINDMFIDSVSFSHNALLQNVVFNNCVFANCSLKRTAFIQSGLINCHLHNCSWENNDNVEDESSMYLISCTSDNGIELSLYKDQDTTENAAQDNHDLLFIILSCFFKEDGRYSPMKRITAIRAELSDYNRKEISKAFDKLSNQKMINMDGDLCFIQKEGISYYYKYK